MESGPAGSGIVSGTGSEPAFVPLNLHVPRFPDQPDDLGPQAIADAERVLDVARKALAHVKGWEPTWNMMASGLPEARAHIRTDTLFGSTRYVQETEWCARLGASRATERLADGATHEWVSVAPTRWSRWGGGKWDKQPAASPMSLADLHLATDELIQTFWAAMPVQVVHRPWGTLVQFVKRAPGGAMEWEIENGSGLVRRIRSWDNLGNAEWNETRDFESVGGHLLLTHRIKQFASGGEQREAILWIVGTNVTSATEFAAPQP